MSAPRNLADALELIDALRANLRSTNHRLERALADVRALEYQLKLVGGGGLAPVNSRFTIAPRAPWRPRPTFDDQ